MTIHLDSMLTTAEAAPWLRLSVRELRSKSKGRFSEIPAFRINSKVVRYCPRVIIAKLASDAGVPAQVITASLGLKEVA